MKIIFISIFIIKQLIIQIFIYLIHFSNTYISKLLFDNEDKLFQLLIEV